MVNDARKHGVRTVLPNIPILADNRLVLIFLLLHCIGIYLEGSIGYWERIILTGVILFRRKVLFKPGLDKRIFFLVVRPIGGP